MTVAGRWMAVVRIAVGLLFLESGIHKLSWGERAAGLPIPALSERWQQSLPRRLLEFAEKNPLSWYRSFLYHVGIPHARLFASLVAWGELLIGLSLGIGLLTRFASFAGAFLTGNYFLANFWMGLCQRNLDLLLLILFLVLGCADAGRSWGLDGRLFRSKKPGVSA
ncbi:DoxX family protein [Methylacidimicrobium sp. B4]|uniref:DoxX family protein n=1 Tax=Methylacidimicrobium sp. B4 TaxID=2796139 RepID=UPI001A8FEC76|nr:DoxX family membrane protein [Methylacidimicrobium sp. B4]QSR85416.1 DoxX family membrane protein [Methylacidimicrobium sp. B4]